MRTMDIRIALAHLPIGTLLPADFVETATGAKHWDGKRIEVMVSDSRDFLTVTGPMPSSIAFPRRAQLDPVTFRAGDEKKVRFWEVIG